MSMKRRGERGEGRMGTLFGICILGLTIYLGFKVIPVMINAYLLATGYARRFDEAWVEALYWENELVAAERLAELRQNGLWATCP